MIRQLLIAMFVLLAGCTDQDNKDVNASNESSTPTITVDQAFDALARYYNVNKLCYDSIQGFLGHFPEKGEAGYVDDENHDHGWFVSDQFRFYRLSNGTWFMAAPRPGETVNITPDVSNLRCREITIPQ